jgi:DNA-binding winged helix-turn-helix (wHTH) protein
VSDTQELLRFGNFELNLATEELRKFGTLLKLAPQPFRLLAMLARRSGQIVTREEIQQTIWGDQTYVDFEQGMNHCVKQIRAALCDSADTPLYIETIPRRGYRFLVPVVTKTILAPAPRVVQSQSGIQTQVSLPPVPSKTAPASPLVPLAVADPTASLKKKTPDPPATTEPASTATPPTVDPQPSQPANRARWIAIAIGVAVVIAVIAGIIYWR